AIQRENVPQRAGRAPRPRSRSVELHAIQWHPVGGKPDIPLFTVPGLRGCRNLPDCNDPVRRVRGVCCRPFPNTGTSGTRLDEPDRRDEFLQLLDSLLPADLRNLYRPLPSAAVRYTRGLPHRPDPVVKTLLMLAASYYQVDAIRAASRMGYRVVTTDNVPSN